MYGEELEHFLDPGEKKAGCCGVFTSIVVRLQ